MLLLLFLLYDLKVWMIKVIVSDKIPVWLRSEDLNVLVRLINRDDGLKSSSSCMVLVLCLRHFWIGYTHKGEIFFFLGGGDFMYSSDYVAHYCTHCVLSFWDVLVLSGKFHWFIFGISHRDQQRSLIRLYDHSFIK